ncbi:MAG: hypothetical protein LBR10_06970, partial [Prevotellaceae bacterium]|nr:hypothetical protein [Prevotellaceae bacterium]
MAISRNNLVTQGLSGDVGGLLFRQVDGETIVSQKAVPSTVATEAQKVQRKRFQRAVIYARSETAASSETNEIYEAVAKKKKKKPHIVAVADFLNAPDIH